MKKTLAALALLALTGQALAFDDHYMGEVRAMPYDYCPEQWVRAEGQLMPITQHTALFALLGTRYGGDGKTTFALPDLRSAALVSKRPDNERPDRPVEKIHWCFAIRGLWPPRPH
ncbi:MAG: tail fiber protein [Alphaproteobacteria bacterium]|nr:tail fiber protein [Alphaproteobacteria bacterium]MBV9692681.1 tail fiber protein [Alphaproteobacteria bacterium]